MKFKILLLALILVGCATTKGYQTKLESFNGVSEAELIKEWGAPQRYYESDGKKFLTYSTSRFVFVSGTGGLSLSCQTTFELGSGKVISSTFKGKDCKN